MKLFAALAATLLFAAPAVATPSPGDTRQFVPMDYGLMLEVPGIGYSRVETLNFCLGIAKVDKFQDLITDWQFVTFEGCMKEHT